MIKSFRLLLLAAILALSGAAISQQIFVNDNGTLREITGVYVNDNGTLRNVQSGYINDNGTLRQFFSAISVSPAGTQAEHDRSRTAANCYAGIHLDNAGEEWAFSNNGIAAGTSLGDWLDAGSTSDVWVRATLNSGTLDGANSGTGTWLATTTSRSWAILDTSDDSFPDIGQVTLEFATDASGTNIIATTVYNLSADYL